MAGSSGPAAGLYMRLGKTPRFADIITQYGRKARSLHLAESLCAGAKSGRFSGTGKPAAAAAYGTDYASTLLPWK